MTVEAVGYTPAQFQEKAGGRGKAVASAFIPGLGQFCDGRNKEGALYLVGTAGSTLTGAALVSKYLKDVFEAQSKASRKAFEISKPGEFLDLANKMKKEAVKNLKKGGIYAACALAVLGSVLWIANIVDAYKGGKKKA